LGEEEEKRSARSREKLYPRDQLAPWPLSMVQMRDFCVGKLNVKQNNGVWYGPSAGAYDPWTGRKTTSR